MEELRDLFEIASGFMPHGYCLQWTPWLFWSYLISDAVTFLCYASDFFAIHHLHKHRPDIAKSWILFGFALFIAACGFVHGLLVVSLFWGIYPIIAVAKAIMALVSLPVAVAVWPVVAKIIASPDVAAYQVLLRESNKLEAEKTAWLKKNRHLKSENKKLRDQIDGTH